MALMSLALCLVLAAGDSAERKQVAELTALEQALTGGASVEAHLSARQNKVNSAEQAVPKADPLRALPAAELESKEPSLSVANELARRAARAEQEVAQATVELINNGYAQLTDGVFSPAERRDMTSQRKALTQLRARADELASLEMFVREQAGATPAAKGAPSNPAKGASAVAAKGASAVDAKGAVVVDAKGASAVDAKGAVAVAAKGASAVDAKGAVVVDAKGASAVAAKGASAVAAKGASAVDAKGAVVADAKGAVAVDAKGAVAVDAKGASAVSAKGASAVSANGASAVDAKGAVAVAANGASAVDAKGAVAVAAKGASAVEAKGASAVDAKGAVLVDAKGASAVDAKGAVAGDAKGASTVKANGASAVDAKGAVAVQAKGAVAVEAKGANPVGARGATAVDVKRAGANAVATKAATPGAGVVTYVTATEAFVDVGQRDGLAQTSQLAVFRRDQQIATCAVLDVAAGDACCRADRPGLKRGDRIAFVPVALAVAQQPAPVGKQRAPLPRPEDVSARRQIVRAAPVPRVPRKAAGLGLSARLATTLRQQVWAISTTPQGVFARSSLDASTRVGITGVPHAFTSASLRVLGDVVAPPEQRFRPGEPVELYVFGASAGIDDGPVVGELGRFRPKKIPGALLLDGAQLGARLFGGTTEVGAYGGALPHLLSLAPALDLLTAGLYLGLDLELSDGILVLPRARAAVLTTADLATVRGELEAQAQFHWANVVSLGGSLRAGMGGTPETAPSLEAGRADADVAWGDALKLSAGYRYLAAPAVDLDLLAAVLPVGGAHHGSAAASLAPWTWLVLGATSGAGYDLVTERARGYAGPQVGLPAAFGSFGGLEVGYLEELGDLAGRSAWMSTTITPVSALRIISRVSYMETVALGDSFKEAGFMLLVDAPVLPWLTVRGRSYVQQGLPSLDGTLRNSPTTLFADLALSGAW